MLAAVFTFYSPPKQNEVHFRLEKFHPAVNKNSQPLELSDRKGVLPNWSSVSLQLAEVFRSRLDRTARLSEIIFLSGFCFISFNRA